jgi:hypothetical protein
MNPYSAPEAEVGDPSPGPGAAEQRRREFIGHERQLKSVGTVFSLPAMVFVIAFMLALVFAVTGDDSVSLPALAAQGTLAALFIALAIGFRRLQPWVKWPGTVVSAIGVLGVPVGTIVFGVVLYLIWCRAGRVVLDPAYRDVIQATPQLQPGPTRTDKVLMAIVLVLFLAFVAALAWQVLV